MEMKTRLLFVPLLLALVASLAACGGSSQDVPANSVAVVGGNPITLAQYNALLAQALAQTKAHGQPEPQPGTQEYTQLKAQVVADLVEIAELEQQAAKEGVTETPSDVDKYIADLVKTGYSGSQKKFEDALKAQGLTMDDAKQQVRITQLATKLKAKVTASATVTPKDEKDYFNSPTYPLTRSVEHILVKQKGLADTIEQKLKNGASFAALAKQYSKDPSSAAQGGKYTATRGKEVPAYDDAAFSLKTGQLSAPVDATSAADGGYGWFIIKALGPVPTFSTVQPAIHSALLQQAQEKLWEQWLSDLTKHYQGKVSYQAGYTPPTTTAVPTSPPPTTG
jgi:parvulin-like peptidyl-prolyl isomerase